VVEQAVDEYPSRYRSWQWCGILGGGGESAQIQTGIDRSATPRRGRYRGEVITTSNDPSSTFRATRDGRTPGRITRSLLRWGVLAGPFYVAVSVILGLTRDGFDFTRHYWSLLANGDFGWVQMANYVLTGLMLVAFAVGLGRALRPGPADRWAPALVGVFGASLVVAGIFTTDPYGDYPFNGFHGTSGRGLLHFAALCIGSVAVAAACFALARRFAADAAPGLARFSGVTGVVFLAGLLPFIATFPGNAVNNVRFTAAVVLVLGWIAAVAAHLYRSLADAT
jgi:hypothetical protein